MTPKKANKLYKELTKEFEIQEGLAEDLIEFYYKTLRKKLSNLTDLRINVDGLGHFVIKIQKVKKAIPHYEKVLKNHDVSTFGAYHNKKNVCDSCPSKGRKCAVKGTAPCCNECGCSLTFKTRSLASECPLGKWQAISTEEEEQQLEKL